MTIKILPYAKWPYYLVINTNDKYKPKANTDNQVWNDAFFIGASIYVLAHPECSTALFKYMQTIRVGAKCFLQKLSAGEIMIYRYNFV